MNKFIAWLRSPLAQAVVAVVLVVFEVLREEDDESSSTRDQPE